MNRLKISVAMCTYKGEKYLKEQLDSIARQTRLPDELIICDDNSADRTLEIINALAAFVSFPVKIHTNSITLGSTKNFEQAITLCEGDIIALSDQDDIWHPDKLTIMEQVFNNSPQTGVLFSNANVVGNDLSPLGYTLWDTYNFKARQKSDFVSGKVFEVLLNHHVVTGATMAFRSRLRDKILPIPTEWVHDAWIAMLAAIYSDVAFIDVPLLEYRQHEDQQIGGLKRTFADKRNLAKSIDNYCAQIRQYELLAEHVQRLKEPCDGHRCAKISEKISHMKARTAIYGCSGIKKIGKAAAELLKGNYHLYSNGFSSLLKDLFLIDKPMKNCEQQHVKSPWSH